MLGDSASSAPVSANPFLLDRCLIPFQRRRGRRGSSMKRRDSMPWTLLPRLIVTPSATRAPASARRFLARHSTRDTRMPLHIGLVERRRAENSARKERRTNRSQQKINKELVVPHADALPDPKTVVVFEDALRVRGRAQGKNGRYEYEWEEGRKGAEAAQGQSHRIAPQLEARGEAEAEVGARRVDLPGSGSREHAAALAPAWATWTHNSCLFTEYKVTRKDVGQDSE
ncbi:hypothetical protein C8R45DRAFT_939343 [Mycena sanguinolenta]|nr:hypothetical protein C8R45DRAFT_939343 [Mycena sanguinolenta]